MKDLHKHYHGNNINRIKEVLKEQGKSQLWLSEKISKSRVITTNYVNNIRQPSLEILREIALVLNVDIRELLLPTKYFKNEEEDYGDFMLVDSAHYDKMMGAVWSYKKKLNQIREVLEG